MRPRGVYTRVAEPCSRLRRKKKKKKKKRSTVAAVRSSVRPGTFTTGHPSAVHRIHQRVEHHEVEVPDHDRRASPAPPRRSVSRWPRPRSTSEVRQRSVSSNHRTFPAHRHHHRCPTCSARYSILLGVPECRLSGGISARLPRYQRSRSRSSCQSSPRRAHARECRRRARLSSTRCTTWNAHPAEQHLSAALAMQPTAQRPAAPSPGARSGASPPGIRGTSAQTRVHTSTCEAQSASSACATRKPGRHPRAAARPGRHRAH